MAGEPFLFWNDKRADDLKSLVAVLGEISYEEFATYVNQSKNDFASWIEGSLENKELADKVRPLLENDLIRAVVSDFIEKENKLIIGTKNAHADDALVKEIMQKNEDFFKSPENATERASQSMHAQADEFELKSAEKQAKSGSTFSLADAPILGRKKERHASELVAGLIFGVIIGALLTIIVQQMILAFG